MKIDGIKIKNYRNLDGMELRFNPELNFFVGENDLGKTNLLDLFDKIFNYGNFNENDYLIKDEKILVSVSLMLNDAEVGLFSDLFDPEDANKININCEMDISDDRITYFHKESGENISFNNIKCVNFLNYKSLRNPSDELNFSRKRGVGRLLYYMVMNTLKDKNTDPSDIINREYIEEQIIDEINEDFKKIRVFEEFGIETSVETDIIDLTSRIISIKDSNDINIRKIGHGIQFSVLIVLNILEHLMNLIETKRYKNCIFNENGIKSISLILGLDEPEIHLHPYRQRNLIKYVSNILKNAEEDFSKLIKNVFDIDSINGQSVIVTHSPNILGTDYKQISRFHRKDGRIKAISGSNINLDDNLYKHLLKSSPYIKEAFFSRCNIIVEGDTELGALPIFAEKIDVDLDKLGISIISADSCASMLKLAKLLNYFEIDNMGIMDGDVFGGYENQIKENQFNICSTVYEDFEEELFRTSEFANYIGVCENEFSINRREICDAAADLGITIDITQPTIFDQIQPLELVQKFRLKESLTESSVNYLRSKKSIIFGRKLALGISKVPGSYKSLLTKAKRYANENKR